MKRVPKKKCKKNKINQTKESEDIGNKKLLLKESAVEVTDDATRKGEELTDDFLTEDDPEIRLMRKLMGSL